VKRFRVFARRYRDGGVPDVTCQELVELVTEYLEGTLEPSDSARFAAHVERCDGCTEYLVQFRETITAVGHLPPESIDPAAATKLLGVFRDWKRGAASL
jgi:anti-sigma factor RsiW